MIELYHLNMILPLILSVIQSLLTTCLNCAICVTKYISLDFLLEWWFLSFLMVDTKSFENERREGNICGYDMWAS